MRTLPNLVFVLAVLLAGCRVKTERPIQIQQVTIAGSPTDATCRMRLAARQTGLSFHFGRNQLNDVISFRLIGPAYEIYAINWTGSSDYEFRLHISSKNGHAIAAAKSTFARLPKIVTDREYRCS